MSRIADDQREARRDRQPDRSGESDDRLAERRAALRRAVSDLGDVTSRFRTRMADNGHELPPPPRRLGGFATLGERDDHPPREQARGASAEAPRRSQGSPDGSPPARPAGRADRASTPSSARAGVPDPVAVDTASTRNVAPDSSATGAAAAYRDAAMAEARERFDSASRQADLLVRTITEAVHSEARALRADIEAGAEARFREIEMEAQRRLRRAHAEADALVEQRRRRIAEVSDRILELGETLAGRLAEADEVRGQFDVFVQALGQASDRLAGEAAAASALESNGSVTALSSTDEPARASGLAEVA
jgi:hypothetical protein